AADVLRDRLEPEEADQPDQDAGRGVNPVVWCSAVRRGNLGGAAAVSPGRPHRGTPSVAHLALSAARADGVTVARVIAPDRRLTTPADYGPDGRPQRLPEDLL